MTEPVQKNLAETLSEVLPKAAIINTIADSAPGLTILHAAVPKGCDLKEIRVDLESTLANPRRTTATAKFSDMTSFLAYVERHASDGSVTWCNFNPQTFELAFTAVIDEHIKGTAGWRAHKATFSPAMSAEWQAWIATDRKALSQTAFAEWIQEHDSDITASEGLPSSLQMLDMATNFVMNEDRQFKSAVRLQSGGFNLTYITNPDEGTTEAMRLFEKFAIGIPVFQGIPAAWGITARLKYRNPGGKLSFFYELVRADRVHEAAAKELIAAVKDGLGAVPLLLGNCG